MEFRWLEDLLSLANTGSFSRSAEAKRITQSAFSRRIQALEAWAGAKLVNRSSTPTTLTPAGRALLDAGLPALRELLRTRDEVRAEERRNPSVLTFIAMHTLSVLFFPSWLRSLGRGPGTFRCRVRGDRKSMEKSAAALIEGGCDFVLSYTHPAVFSDLSTPEFESLLLAEEDIVPVARASVDGSPLFAFPGAPNQPVPTLQYTRTSFLGRCMEALETGRSMNLQPISENGLAEGLRTMVLEGYGAAWLPRACIASDLAEARVALAGEPNHGFRVEIRLFRLRENRRCEVEGLWSAAGRLALAASQASLQFAALSSQSNLGAAK
jgi:LysR family transcriptional regulator, hypochlorite-specific transcription factor HypT